MESLLLVRPLGITLAVGLLLGGLGLWPTGSLHAMATDRVDFCAIATGSVDSEAEALYVLDFLTGELRATVIGKRAGSFPASFFRNVAADLGVDMQKNPKFMMVTGHAMMQRTSGNKQPSLAACYVAELTSGKVAVYLIPWDASARQANRPQSGEISLFGVTQFRAGAGGAGAVTAPAAATPRRRAH